MKVYRVIGSVISSIVSILLVFVLFATLIGAGVCAVVSEDTVEKLTATLVKDEQVQTIAKEALKNITIGSGEDATPLPEETVDALLGSEAIQEGLSKIVAETLTATITENSENIDVSGTVKEMIDAEPELFNDVLEKVLITNDVTYDDIFEQLVGIEIPESGELPTTIENPLGADLPPITVPEYGASLSELASSWVEQNPEAVNETIRKYVGEGFSLGDLSGFLGGGGNIDYALGENGETPEISEGEFGITSVESGDEFVTAPGISLLSNGFSPEVLIDFLRQLLTISPVVVLAVALGVLVVLYLLAALLTWSLRTPLSFVGIVSLIGGTLTLVVSCLPVLSLLSSVELPEIAVTAIELIWTTLSGKLLLYGLAFMGIGIVLFALFILFKVLKKKKPALAS